MRAEAEEFRMDLKEAQDEIKKLKDPARKES